MPTFEMKTVPADAKVTYSIYEPGKQEMWRGYDSSSAKSSLPIEDSKVANNLLKQDLLAEATSIEGNPKVKVLVEKVVTPFTQNKLTVTDIKNTKRFASAGKTLYFINKPLKTDYKEIKLEATLSQTDDNKIPKENIKWKINDKENEYKEGDTEFTIPITDKIKNATFTNSAGFPTMTDKTVSVKWVDEDRKDASFMPPAVSHLITQFNDDLLKPCKKLTDKLDQWTGSKPGDKQNFKVEIKPIKIKGELFNEEDINSRQYFEVLKGSINGGISLKGEFFGYPPFLKPLNIDNVSKVGFFISPKIDINLVGAKLKKTIGETKKTLKDEFAIEGNIKGCIEVGLKAELTVDQDKKDYIEFSVKGSGEGCVSGKKIFNFSTNKWDGGFYIDPIKLAVKAKISSKGYFKFTLVDFDGSYIITDKVDLSEK